MRPPTARRIAALAVGVLATGTALAAPASAANIPVPCARQVAAAKEVQKKIKAHNARDSSLRTNAQIDAYNAEARQLNAQRASVTAAVRGCAKLYDSLDVGDDASAPDASALQAIDGARSKIPSGYRAASDTVVVPSQLRPLFAQLRKNSAYRNDDELQGTRQPQIGDPDSAFSSDSGRTIGAGSDGRTGVVEDHIVPLSRLVTLPGFTQLSPLNMYLVAESPVDLQWASSAASLARSSSSVASVLGADQGWLARQRSLEKRTEASLTKLIASMLKYQGEYHSTGSDSGSAT